MTTNIRIEVDESLYSALLREQNRRKQNSTRKISFSNLIIEFCTKSLSEIECNDHQLGENDQKNAMDNNEMIKNSISNEQNIRQKLLTMQHDLQKKEQSLAVREKNLAQREREINSQTLEIVREREELMDRKEHMQQQSIDAATMKWQFEQSAADIKSKTEALREQKRENEQLKEHIIKVVRHIDQKTDKNTMMEYIVPFLPSVISIIGFFLTNRKIEGIQELSPIQNEINNIIKGLSNSDKEKFNGILKQGIRNFQSINRKQL